eukprot:5285028-Prymnesium_polylepis.1
MGHLLVARVEEGPAAHAVFLLGLAELRRQLHHRALEPLRIVLGLAAVAAHADAEAVQDVLPDADESVVADSLGECRANLGRLDLILRTRAHRAAQPQFRAAQSDGARSVARCGRAWRARAQLVWTLRRQRKCSERAERMAAGLCAAAVVYRARACGTAGQGRTGQAVHHVCFAGALCRVAVACATAHGGARRRAPWRARGLWVRSAHLWVADRRLYGTHGP